MNNKGTIIYIIGFLILLGIYISVRTFISKSLLNFDDTSYTYGYCMGILMAVLFGVLDVIAMIFDD